MVKKQTNKWHQTHQLIIMKAAELFNSNGYASTSISDIMQATGLKKGGIYSHFKNKETLEVAAFKYLLKCIFDDFDTSLFENKTAVEKLLIMIKYRESLNKTLLKGGCPILNAGAEASDHNLELLNDVRKSIERWKTSIIEIINEGIIKKEIKPQIDPEEFALYFITVFEGATFLYQVDNNSGYKEKAIAQLKHTIIENLSI